jgi:hypothetical protein
MERAASAPAEYHHIPTGAAQAFQRTATPGKKVRGRGDARARTRVGSGSGSGDGKPLVEGRNDWVEREDGGEVREKERDRRTVRERVLQRKDSMWILIGRFKEKSSAPSRSNREADGSGSGERASPLARKRSFLARFRRQPS